MGAVWDGVFVLFGLFVIVPATVPFGVMWTLLAGIFTALDVLRAATSRHSPIRDSTTYSITSVLPPGFRAGMGGSPRRPSASWPCWRA